MDPIAGIVVELDVPMATRDGVPLAANIYRPAGDGRWPVLLTRLPYGKDLPLGVATLDPVQAARRGYVVIVQDTRGTGRSAGVWEPLIHEGNDGVDTIAWAAALPYADGRVGVYGASYFGFTQWSAAIQRPPALQALVPLNTWSDPLDGLAARGGALELGVQASWNLEMGLGVLLRRFADDPQALMQAVYALSVELDNLGPHGYWSLPLQEFAPLRRQPVAPTFFATAADPVDAHVEPIASATIAGHQQGLHTPSLNIGGWYDVFLGGTLANYRAMQGQGAPTRLIVGPWTHVAQGRPVGQRDFGYASQEGFLNLQGNLQGIALRWFDHWLKDIDTGILAEPPVKLFVMGKNVWRDEQEWPLARAVPQPCYLHAGGRLGFDAPGSETPDIYLYNPADPTPTLGGNTLLTPDFPAGPYDQRPIEARPDVLVFTSEPLPEDLEVTGPLVVHLWAASSAPDTDFVARLCDVFPDGRSFNLADGIVRARYRHFPQGGAAALIEPGQVYHYELDLWATSNVFLAGHRLRVHITSSSFPRWDRNPNTGHAPGADADLVPAVQTILHDAEHPSHILLPVVPFPG